MITTYPYLEHIAVLKDSKLVHCFCVCYGGGHAAMLLPIVQQLQQRKYQVSILALTTAQYFFKKNNIPFIGYKDFPGANNLEVQKIGKELFKNLPRNSLVDPEETIAYLGYNFLELIQKYGSQEAYRLYKEKGRQAFFPIKTLTKVLADFNPDLLIATNSPRSERAAFLAARDLNIPSVCLVDLFALQEIQWIKQKNYSTKICALNKYVKNFFLKNGKDDNEVVVTGNPAFDSLYSEKIRKAGSILKKDHCWDDGKINLLWASQPEPKIHPFSNKKGDPSLPRKIEQILRSFVQRHPEYRLIIRYHPSESTDFMPEERVQLSPIEENLQALLHAVDAVIVTASTVGLEAHLIGKPVLSVDCSVWAEDVQYAVQKISTGVKGIEALPKTILSLSSKRPQLPFNNTQASATQRVLTVIEEILAS